MNLSRLIFPTILLLTSPALFANNSAFIDHSAGKCSATNDAGSIVYTTDTRIVATHDPDTQTTHLRCSFGTTPTVTGKAWNEEGFLCVTFNPDVGIMLTYETHIKQTPRGKMILSCHFEAF